jgi:general secretion pathway protein D
MPPQDSPAVFTAGTALPAQPASADEILPLDIEKTINRGQEAWKNGDLSQAQKYFEAVLYTDPLNKDAIRWLKRIADKKTDREEKSYSTTRARMLEDVQAAWNTPKATGERPADSTSGRAPTEAEQKTLALKNKLHNIRIPAITFQNADIQQVVLELSALCRKLDGEGRGVNLVTYGTTETLLPPVTFSGTDLSALETLDIITQMAGMKYDIGPNLVSLTPVNYEPPQQMVSTEFDVMASVGAKMAMMAGGQAGASGLIDVTGFFSTVAFPGGSSAQYNPEFDLLLVRNVPKHIDQIAALLQRYNQKALAERSRQVEIETKFIEVAEGALDELGFEWTFGESGTYLNDDTWVVPGGQKLFSDTLRTGAETFDSAVGSSRAASSFNSYAGSSASSLADGLVSNAGELLIQKIKGEVQIDLLIRALERQEGSDLLSAPKVLTRSGETATIHVGEIRSFPTAYDIIIERYAQPSLLPLDYEQYKTGVMLEVTPELDSENGTIELDLAPEITELEGFDEQHAATIWPDFGDEQIDIETSSSITESTPSLFDFLTAREENRTVNADRLIARQPVFKTRKVQTSVTIEDGSTIAMGGLIKEQMETFKDSVPILGKIPLIGRLFRSEGERSVKRNLIIFVTANQVDAAGHRKSAE